MWRRAVSGPGLELGTTEVPHSTPEGGGNAPTSCLPFAIKTEEQT